MSYTIAYNDQSMKQKDAKALQDIKNWFGTTKRFNEVADSMLAVIQDGYAKKVKGTTIINQFKLYLSFGGVTGYPAMTLYRHLINRRVRLFNDNGIEIASGKPYYLTNHVLKLVEHGYGTLADYSTKL